MSRFLCFALALFFLCAVNASNQEIDSLRIELVKTNSDNNTKLCEIYQSLAVCYETINLDSTSYFLNQAFSLYKKPNYKDWGYLHLINTQANYYYSNGDFEKAKQGFSSALNHSLKMEERDYDFDAAVAMSLGVVYRKVGKQDSTVYYYNMAADYGKLSGNYSTLSSIYYNIGAMYHGNFRYDDALVNANYAVEYSEKSGDFIMQIYSRILLGGCYARKEMYSESINVLKRNISDALKHDSPLMAMSSLGPLISSYQLWNKKDSVSPYLELGRKLIHKIPEGHPTALEYIATEASVYGWLGEYAKSNEILMRNEQVIPQIGDIKYYILLAKNYNGLGDYKKAYNNLQTAYELNDSLYKNKTSTEMSELSAKLNVNAKELEISRLETEKAEQKANQLRMGLYLGGIILVLFIIILILQSKRRIQQKESELVSVRKYIEGLENERKRLAKELHDGVCNDLYGAILQIQRSDVTEESKKDAVKLIDGIRNGVRTISHELMPPSFKFADLDEMLDSYFAKIQDQSGIDIKFSSQSDIEWVNISHEVSYEVYRICQEITGNIIKHCKVPEVTIRMEVEHGIMNLSFSYNGIWSINSGKISGIGLRTIDDRLKMIGGNINISEDNGILIKLLINLSHK